MSVDNWAALVLAALSSATLTGVMRRHAFASGVMDVPNSRSSHATPTPRGGGFAIVVTILLGLVAIGGLMPIRVETMLACGMSALLVAAVGYVDDRRSVAVLPRLGIHVFAAFLLVVLLLRQQEARHFLREWPLWCEIVLLLLGTVWSINLFNFMDGIDGIAASQAVFVAGASGMLAVMTGAEPTPWIALCALTAGASLGFLVWNWPPARIFMGDVGSGFLGFWLAALAIGMHVHRVLPLWTSIILSSVFIADASVTLLRRMARGERWYEAHRSHAYQHQARKWGSHRRVTVGVWIFNLFLVLPIAYASIVWQGLAAWIAAAWFVLLCISCLALGAGKASS